MARKRDKVLDQRMRARGWELVRDRNHKVWRCSCGEHQMVTPLTTSDWRAAKNAIAESRKCPLSEQLEGEEDE